jgi:hypothetical protein
MRMKRSHEWLKYLRIGLLSGLVALVLIFSPYLWNAIWILGGSIFHQIVWQTKGSPNYTIRSELDSFSPIRGINVLNVKQGKIISFTIEQSQFMGDKHKPDDFEELTIEAMFHSAYPCAFRYPWLKCSFKYDPVFGYPKEAIIDCPNIDMCYSKINVIEVRFP